MRLPDLDIDAVRTFVTVMEAGGFTAAAERLGRTQSAISMKIKRLEELLDRRLLDRTSRSLAPTPAGERLLGHARRILALNDEAVAHVLAPEAEGLLRFGVADYFAPEHLPTILARFAKAYPRVRLDVRVGSSLELIRGLEAEQLDLVIAKRDAGSSAGRLLWREPAVWVAAGDWRAEPGAPVPLCLMPSPCIYRARAVEALDRRARPWRTAYASASIASVRAAAQAGLGVTTLGVASLLPGLRVLGEEEGFPALEPVDIAVFGEDKASRAVARPLVEFLVDALQSLVNPVTLAA
ncbi:LysR substrate-binding domain-containing protein [Oleisolibacter albus]|uniref:LysR substrate-binding domain-containing protein n=1 Tax=Oleisolibacter albus TaxID=2171757 RepID=UPI000DF1A648|nr:LysR substrate-binding domain-containing protein [Oleisolibacter albus]